MNDICRADHVAAEGYYADKLERLADIFGVTHVHLSDVGIVVDGHTYPVIDDVIVLLDPSQYPAAIRSRLNESKSTERLPAYAPAIQAHYSQVWQAWSDYEPWYEREFHGYFDLVELQSLDGARVCDLGCGMGRWSRMLAERANIREVVLIDFSEAIFIARRLFAGDNRALFFMGDLLRLPFRNQFADFAMSLGVLHHLPIDCLQAARRLKTVAPRLLVYLYYAFDNKPFYWRLLWNLCTPLRRLLCRVQSHSFRVAFSWFGVVVFYLPFIMFGYLLRPLGLSKYVPLFEEHHWAGLGGMRHSVYDRFFTTIEQRVSRKQISSLRDTYRHVTIADGQSYWHFLCEAW
jgi:SAM-dependent methyltransferase